jgi:uncharacterized protein (TIGR02271 family)
MPTKEDVATWRGQSLHGPDAEKIGTIEEIYLDEATDQPEWALVNTGLFGTKQSFVPLRGASPSSDGVSVGYDKTTVKDAPKVEPDGRLSQEEEAELYRHYGLDYSESSSDSGLAEGDLSGSEDAPGTVGRDVSGPTTDDAMTRSEERLRAATERVEAGRARLRKYVVTEQQQVTVPVSREQVRLEREPITDANVGQAMTGPDLSEEEHEVVLTEERPVVTTEAVPVERVRMAKHAVESEETVSADVRKERIDVEGDDVERVDR